jgi:hypothetical protein
MALQATDRRYERFKNSGRELGYRTGSTCRCRKGDSASSDEQQGNLSAAMERRIQMHRPETMNSASLDLQRSYAEAVQQALAALSHRMQAVRKKSGRVIRELSSFLAMGGDLWREHKK